MSYLKKTEYRIIPREAYQMIRNCAGCGCKRNYRSTDHFRVNANGKRIDVWLIYQCEQCRHTYNMTVHERVSPKNIPEATYRLFLANDSALALKCGMDKQLLAKSKAEIDWNRISYDLIPIVSADDSPEIKEQKEPLQGLKAERPAQRLKTEQAEHSTKEIITEQITIENPYELKIRTDKIAAELLGITRNKINQMEKNGFIKYSQNYLGLRTQIRIRK